MIYRCAEALHKYTYLLNELMSPVKSKKRQCQDSLSTILGMGGGGRPEEVLVDCMNTNITLYFDS